jgi:hypothetical protein
MRRSYERGVTLIADGAVRSRARIDRKARMFDEPQPREVLVLTATAERLDALADTAELMGDRAGADRLRERASSCRLRAMRSLDD